MKIYELTHITDDVEVAFGKLIPQLASGISLPTKDWLEEIVKSGNAKIFVAEENVITGTLTLVLQKTPVGEKAWIEDVVVDASARGKGIGEKLIRHAIDYAVQQGVTKVDLTSRQERNAANRLYKKMGFVKRETNVYRLMISSNNLNSLQ